VKLATTGAWLAGSTYILYQYSDDPEALTTIVQEVVLPMGMLVIAFLRGSIRIVLWTKELNALEELWRRYTLL
jgi:hypothetical protein